MQVVLIGKKAPGALLEGVSLSGRNEQTDINSRRDRTHTRVRLSRLESRPRSCGDEPNERALA
jgi:hypothetical protein